MRTWLVLGIAASCLSAQEIQLWLTKLLMTGEERGDLKRDKSVDFSPKRQKLFFFPNAFWNALACPKQLQCIVKILLIIILIISIVVLIKIEPISTEDISVLQLWAGTHVWNFLHPTISISICIDNWHHFLSWSGELGNWKCPAVPTFATHSMLDFCVPPP